MGISKIEYRIKIGYFNQALVKQSVNKELSPSLSVVNSIFLLYLVVMPDLSSQRVQTYPTKLDFSNPTYLQIFTDMERVRIYTSVPTKSFEFSQLQRTFSGLSNNKIFV